MGQKLVDYQKISLVRVFNKHYFNITIISFFSSFPLNKKVVSKLPILEKEGVEEF